MPEPLDEYARKRDFGKTPEPRGKARSGGRKPGGAAPARAPVFVVHRHEARRLHYDLRLEVEGVLASWAVPKGFSYDPEDKKLAVQTEEHPLEYQDFSGVIPKGAYGAGTMVIWDRGSFDLVQADDARAAIAAGEVKVVLRGRRLRGEWHLVKTRGEKDWLLFKSRDRYAGPPRDSALGIDLGAAPEQPLPRDVQPMTCGTVAAAAVSDPAWVFEMGFRGRRAFAIVDHGQATLAGIDAPLPEIEAALRELAAERAVLDGVLVALDDAQRPDEAQLEERLRAGGANAAGVYYYAFDLLHWEDYDLRPLPLLERKAALRAIVPPDRHVLYVDHVLGEGPSLLEALAANGLPYAVAKRAASAYVSGPSLDWQRIDATAGASNADATGDRPRRIAARRVKFSNLDKVLWPAEGYTKRDLVAWYESAAESLLPHLRERPLHLNRFPDGIDGKSFYQRQIQGLPDWVQTVPIEPTGPGYVVCNDLDTLLWLANLASIDLHPWLSRRGSLDSPDWSVLDLDAKQATFQNAVRVAREAGKLLRGIGLRPLVKTSGKTGLHVYVPLAEGYSYEQSKMFCEAVARLLVRELPDVATVERTPGARGRKVYCDYGQNRRQQTVVPPYSVRPVRGATVSAPLSWDELDGALRPDQFTIRTMPARLQRVGELFRPALLDRQDLLPAIEALERQLRG